MAEMNMHSYVEYAVLKNMQKNTCIMGHEGVVWWKRDYMGVNNVALKLTDELSETFYKVREQYGLTTSELVRISVGMFLAHSDALTIEEMLELIKKYRRIERKPKRRKSDGTVQKELDFVGEQA